MTSLSHVTLICDYHDGTRPVGQRGCRARFDSNAISPAEARRAAKAAGWKVTTDCPSGVPKADFCPEHKDGAA